MSVFVLHTKITFSPIHELFNFLPATILIPWPCIPLSWEPTCPYLRCKVFYKATNKSPYVGSINLVYYAHQLLTQKYTSVYLQRHYFI